MNWCEIQSNWGQFKPVLKAYWPHLTEGDLDAVGGSRDRLVEVIRNCYCCPAVEAERRVAEFENDVRFPGAVK